MPFSPKIKKGISTIGRKSIFEIIVDRRYDAYVLDIGRVLVAIFDRELALARCLYLAETTVRVSRKLGGSLAGVAGGLGYHFGLDGVEVGVFISSV